MNTANYDLAMTRAEKLRQAFIDNGIDVSEIQKFYNDDGDVDMIGFETTNLFDCEGSGLYFSYSTDTGNLNSNA